LPWKERQADQVWEIKKKCSAVARVLGAADANTVHCQRVLYLNALITFGELMEFCYVKV
jgi:hypothetical protein